MLFKKITKPTLLHKVLDETISMDLTLAIFLKVVYMLLSAITFVFSKIILRIFLIQFDHKPIPCYLGKNAGACNVVTLGIPLDYTICHIITT